MRVSSRAAQSRSVTSRSYQRWMVVMGAATKRSKSKGLCAPGAARRRQACSIRRCGMAEVGGEDHGAGLHARASPVANLPSAMRGARDGIDAGVHAHIDAEAARQLDHGLEELAHRLGGNPQAASLRRAQKRFVEDLAGVLRGTIFKAVVERAGNDGLPEVADGAVGLAGALEPCGEALAIAGGIAAQEARQTGCDGGLVAQTEHGRAQEADGLVRGRGQTARTDPTAARTTLAPENKARRTSGWTTLLPPDR